MASRPRRDADRTFRMTRAMLKKMQPRGRGVIVNNASVLGWRAQKEQAHYAAAKAGVMALTRCAALEGRRIRCAHQRGVAVHRVSRTSEEELRRSSCSRILASREPSAAQPEVWEIANVMVFLASDYSSYLVGETISASSQHP